MNMFKKILSTAVVSLCLTTAATAAEKSFYYISPNPIGVNAFLQMGEVGIKSAAAQNDAIAKIVESDTPQSRLENISAAANDGADIVVVLGFAFNDILEEVAPLYPDTQFLIVDQCIWVDRPENVSCAVFREHEASFLMGAIAGLNTKNNKIGAVSAMDIPFLHRYTDSFAEGAKYVNSDVEFEVRYVGGQNPFQDPVRAKEMAISLAASGVDTLFAVTAGGDFGIFEAAAENGFKVLSVDVNHCPAAEGHIIEGTLKHVDAVIETSIERILAGETSFVASYGLKEGGMGAQILRSDAELADSKCLVADQADTIKAVRAIAAEIIDGSLVIKDPMAN
ncbi:MAG: BMP family ABC transporter substrate-binding protein [Alphaproteobacteria bacterium]|nr:BMP family ABC transporter substrate-binding protein [Alphaproteobacteria bacterium]